MHDSTMTGDTGNETQPDAGAHLLSNGRYALLLTGAGGGYSALSGYALTRWTPDPARDADGFFLYIRDLESGSCWSAGYQPLQRQPETYEARFRPGRAEIERRDEQIQIRTEVCVAPEDNAEFRRYTLANHGDQPRRLELTTYAEIVLNTPAGDAGHPAFSKLFVQTDFLPEHQALLARRRLRSPDDQPLWLAHRLLGGAPDSGVASVEYETDRARFLGRGRTPANPRALDAGARLSGTVGNVLDPVFSLRREIELAPGETLHVVALLAAGASRAEVEVLLGRYASASAAEAAFEIAAPAPEGAERALGLPPSWAGVRLRGGSPAGSPARGAAADGDESRYRAAETGGADAAIEPEPSTGEEDLVLFNGYGGFSADGTEYVIHLPPRPEGPQWPPLPWINVVANEELGFLASESGAGYTWSVNSRENRLTPWFNDPVSNPHGEALYIRDEEESVFWSPTPGPVPALAAYEVRHGFGYTQYLHTSHKLEQEVWQFVPRRDPVKIIRVRLTNRSDRPRRLSIFSYAQWVLGVLPAETRGQVVTERDPETGALLARNPARGEFAERVAFAAAVPPEGVGEVHLTTDRTAFLGRYGSTANPQALRSAAPLDGKTGEMADPCAAFGVPVELAPGETAECAFLLGEAATAAAASALVRRFRSAPAVAEALERVRDFWKQMLTAVQVETPSPAINLMVNGWLAYQNLSCRMWGRSAFYQSGGAFGFRDQLQDSSALLYLQPDLTRRQILLHAAHQFVEGDVLHWWHPPLSKGIRTRFSDDLLWLPYITAFYIAKTGDQSVLSEQARFLKAPLLEPGEDETFLIPEDSGEAADVYEHCCRAIDRSLTRGAHGLPLMGVGDWNDGMNRVGREGRGESVWLGFFLYGILEDFIPLCERRGDNGRVERYREYQAHLENVLNDTGWDGAWYRRAYYDNGAPLGSAESDECRIDTLAQAWAVLSGAAPPERAAQALDAMEEHLVSEEEGLIRLLTPAFDKTPHDPGYIKGYLPGVRENGGQYTHGALWAVRALAEFGRGDRAARLLEMLSPVSHARTPEEVAVYQTEPYVIAADVYGVAPHVGRGGWTWYTGSAGWMYRVALESVLGLDLQGGRTIALRPCIPDDWPGFRLCYRLPDGRTTYEIEVERADGSADVRTVAQLDGEPLGVENGAVVIPIARDGAVHRARVMLGSDVGPRYAPRLESASQAQ